MSSKNSRRLSSDHEPLLQNAQPQPRSRAHHPPESSTSQVQDTRTITLPITPITRHKTSQSSDQPSIQPKPCTEAEAEAEICTRSKEPNRFPRGANFESP
ncbi:hypothetical protein HYFRA_00006393 [Hymenoscyphus fraxineus]|uniref:Uncharacterized protein n=1 Tax=Hymenoscyphus fraxineus TaxID=746836 RepID=A0A9N9KPK1_9HELO|nr:hypothetical protein HYFRA_00006393 [Hymenoscyphus fraxineus]